MNPIDFTGVNFCATSGALTATGTETVYDTTVTISFCINGKALTKTAVTDGATPTTDIITGVALETFAANQGCVVLWGLQADGTVVLAQSEIRTMVEGKFINAPEFPVLPDSVCAFAYQVLKADSTAGTITIGTSNWDATGFTNAVVNLLAIPNRPQVA